MEEEKRDTFYAVVIRGRRVKWAQKFNVPLVFYKSVRVYIYNNNNNELLKKFVLCYLSLSEKINFN